MLKVVHRRVPELDASFVSAALWNRAYRMKVAGEAKRRDVVFEVSRPQKSGWPFRTQMLPDRPAYAELNWKYAERLSKSLLWIWGGNRISISGAGEIVARLAKCYSAEGERGFDYQFMGMTCFLEPFEIVETTMAERQREAIELEIKRDLKGCRIGFDLGGSDRKCAALIDGEVVYSEEIKWDPYFQTSPEYHLAGIQDSLERAAKHLPRVDAIGGSAAGVYFDNEPRVGSLFRGVSARDFEVYVRPIFKTLRERWGQVPFEVANDGEVTALAGSMALERNCLLGIAMGTSLASGYVDANGRITGWLNELAFVPVDYAEGAPEDEWSGDRGCGVQYFSQQAVGRLLPASGLEVDGRLGLPEKLERVQEKLKEGDDRAASIFRTMGTYLGYTLAHYSEFYTIEQFMFLGRVSSGEGGLLIQKSAEEVLAVEFPEYGDTIRISMPDETMKRHGQAIAAASLPTIRR